MKVVASKLNEILQYNASSLTETAIDLFLLRVGGMERDAMWIHHHEHITRVHISEYSHTRKLGTANDVILCPHKATTSFYRPWFMQFVLHVLLSFSLIYS